MNLFYAILLGIIQGITEFLPISSTAHLTLAGKLFGLIQDPEDWTAFIAIMQLGTVAAVILYFLKDLIRIVHSCIADLAAAPSEGRSSRWSADSHLAGKIIVGTIPVGVIGLTLRKIIEGELTKQTAVIATGLIVLALLLLWAERRGGHNRPESQTTWLDALIIGTAQACALIPGSSRSGTTITAGLFLGLTRESAARFSFLLSIPAVIGSGLFELYESRHHLGHMGIYPLIISTVVSGIVGYASIAGLLKYLRLHTTYPFIWYRLLLGVLLLALLAAGRA